MWDLNTTMESPDFTFSYSKFSCVREMYVAHVFFCYVVFITGLLAMVVRLVPSVKFMHIWCAPCTSHVLDAYGVVERLPAFGIFALVLREEYSVASP
mmetsp:Transcript_9892/g.25174  ORF Transcript_9892/g.25174 Transcript_9892/m.25174 type:complete len:97 (+) Transcript_9892:237-527(+)